jgi:ABC-2 type transport system ATP-binding protein
MCIRDREAERLCDRVAILDHGKLIALDSPQALVNGLGDENRVVFETDRPVEQALFAALPGVTRVERIGERTLVYGRKDGLIGRVVNTLEGARVPFNNIHAEQPTLEDVFLKLTGKEIRE